MRIGVLASQGAFAEHIAVLHKLEVEAVPIRLPRELTGLDGLIIPGGESTSISRLMLSDGLADKVRNLAENDLPVFGTCAGMIMLASEVLDSSVKSLGLLDVRVRRNAFGRQKDSFETDLIIPALGDKPFTGVFIRAPIIERVSDGVEILARLSDSSIVAVRQGNKVASAFHPELTDDLRFHQYFLDIAAQYR
ncbi:pyridoxal 5'-phosphate synthase glutaminase subunit PdxT [Chloroflexota bacterium]